MRLACRGVSLVVTQCLIYPVRAMLLWEKLINQVCISTQLCDLGSHMMKVLMRLKLCASVASGEGWHAEERGTEVAPRSLSPPRTPGRKSPARLSTGQGTL